MENKINVSDSYNQTSSSFFDPFFQSFGNLDDDNFGCSTVFPGMLDEVEDEELEPADPSLDKALNHF